MTSLEYQVLSRRLYSDFPVIGWLLRRWAAWQLAKDDGSGEAVAILAEVVTRGQDRAVREMALAVLNRLRTQDAINGFCRVWAETRHKDLAAILRSRRYVATEPRLRVLSALKVGALDVVKRGGVEVLDFLLAALSDSDTQVATVAASCVSALENRVVIDELCRRWVESRSSQLEGIIRKGGYVASQPVAVRVLTALKLNQIQEIRDGGIEVLDCVLKAFDDRDMEVVRSAKACTAKLKNKDMIDFLCEKWIENPISVLEVIIQKAGYTPSRPSVKALFFFLLGEWQKYEDLDFDLSLLSKAYYEASEKTKQNIANKAKMAGRIEWIQVLTNAKDGFNVDTMTDEDWETFVNILAAEPNKKEIWKFLYNAPALYSKKLLDKLDGQASLQNFGKEEEVILKTLLSLSKKTNESYFLFISYLLYQEVKQKRFLGNSGTRIWSLAISPDGCILALGESDSIDLRSLSDGNHFQTLALNTNINIVNHIFALAISPNGHILASGSRNGQIQLWSLPEGKLLQTLSGHKFDVNALAISPNGNILVSGSRDTTIRLWNLPDGSHLKTLSCHSDSVLSLAISPNGHILTAGCYNGSIHLWRLPDGSHLKTLSGHKDYVEALAISPNGHTLASASGDKTIRLWHLQEARSSFSVHDDSSYKTLRGHTNDISSLAISPNGLILASSGPDGVRVWSLPNGNHLKTGHYAGVGTGIVLIPDDCTLVLRDPASATICIWSLDNISITKFTNQDISKIKSKIQNRNLEKGYLNALKFTLALIQLRKQFDIDIEDVSSDVEFSEFDIEIDG